MGVSVLVVGLTVDGFPEMRLADVWIGSVGLEQSDVLGISQAVETFHEDLFTVFVFLLFGVAILLYELAVALGEGYPRGIGVVILSGAGTAIADATMFLSGGPSPATEPTFLLLSLVSTCWVLIMGVLMWRKAGAIESDTREVLQMQGLSSGRAGISAALVANAKEVVLASSTSRSACDLSSPSSRGRHTGTVHRRGGSRRRRPISHLSSSTVTLAVTISGRLAPKLHARLAAQQLLKGGRGWRLRMR